MLFFCMLLIQTKAIDANGNYTKATRVDLLEDAVIDLLQSQMNES
ncbi:hypothetical protein ACIQD3_14790 [Peribacillus loiseleuriae]